MLIFLEKEKIFTNHTPFLFIACIRHFNLMRIFQLKKLRNNLETQLQASWEDTWQAVAWPLFRRIVDEKEEASRKRGGEEQERIVGWFWLVDGLTNEERMLDAMDWMH